jgi:hypothetical protein
MTEGKVPTLTRDPQPEAPTPTEANWPVILTGLTALAVVTLLAAKGPDMAIRLENANQLTHSGAELLRTAVYTLRCVESTALVAASLSLIRHLAHRR